ncbi:oligopeptide transporter [Tanacetum coccineum]
MILFFLVLLDLISNLQSYMVFMVFSGKERVFEMRGDGIPDGKCGTQSLKRGVLRELMHYFDQAFNSFNFGEKCSTHWGRLPTERLTPDENEGRSDWALEKMMKKDVEREDTYEQMRKFLEDMKVGPGFRQGGPSSFSTQKNSSFFEAAQATHSYSHNMATPNWQTPMPSQPRTSNRQSQMPLQSATPNWEPPIPSHPEYIESSIYRQSPYMDLTSTTVLPKKQVDKTKNKGKKAKLSPLNLRNAFADDNVGGDDVMITSVHETGIYFTYENVDPNKVYMPINARGNHWVTGAINLPNSIFYVFDSMESEGTRFTSPPGRKLIGGMVATVDPVKLDSFSTNQVKLILTNSLGYDEKSPTFLYLMKPNCSLDSGLVPLADAIQDRDMLLTYTQTHQNRLHVYVSRVEISPLVVADQRKDERNKKENQGKPSCMKAIKNDYDTNVMYDIAKVAGKLQLFVSHYQIDLSTVLIPNDGSLEESFAGTKIHALYYKIPHNGFTITVKLRNNYDMHVMFDISSANYNLEIYIDHLGVDFIIAKYIFLNASLAEMMNHVITNYTSESKDDKREVTQNDYTFDQMVEWAEQEHFEDEEIKEVQRQHLKNRMY